MGLWQYQVSPRAGQIDPVGREAAQILADFGIRSVQAVHSTKLFTIDLAGNGERNGEHENAIAQRIATELLTDPVVEVCRIVSADTVATDAVATDSVATDPATTTNDTHCDPSQPEDVLAVEVHFKPGVMDNVANSTQLALEEMGITATSVRTGRRYVLHPTPSEADLKRIPRLLGNDCVEDVIVGTKPIEPAPQPAIHAFELRRIAIRDLDDSALEALSRDGHLFLTLEEMQTIQSHFRTAGREPTDLELETLAQTWSEHCVHKTLKATIEYQGAPFPSDSSASEGEKRTTRRYENLLRDTIVRATDELMRDGIGPECLSVFVDNAGVISFDEDYGIAFKVETHNHPSAIEPYGGAATGAGGCIRDIMGCGLGAKPIANTDIFCVAPPDWPVESVPKGVIHPKSVLKGIVAGVRDYGNQMGIPTVNGAIQFDPRYLGNPLVYCGCVGLIPRNRIEKAARPGDAILVMGGRTGRDGIHGATFSSAELTDTHEDEFAHAVQIGNPIEEKKVLDVLLQARDYPSKDGETRCLYSATTDCGAGGLSSAVGEMGEKIGAEVNLERVPLKYAGLRHDEIWISEAQERMVFAVPPEDIEAILALAVSESVEATVIGEFTDTKELVVRYEGTEIGRLDMQFLHDGLPRTTRKAEWWPAKSEKQTPSACTEPGGCPIQRNPKAVAQELKRRLSDPTTASKHWIIRQYDHEVQAGSVVKPLAGSFDGPSDAAVVRPRLDSERGIALGCGMAPHLTEVDPYFAAVAAIDEAIRNVVCVGGDPTQTAVLDNFCWPRVDNPRGLGELVRACQACYDVAKVYGIPFISGKDSLNNEFSLDSGDVEMVRRVIRERYSDNGSPSDGLRDGRIAIPGTLLISAMSIIDDVSRCLTMDIKQEESQLYLVGRPVRLMSGDGNGDGDANANGDDGGDGDNFGYGGRPGDLSSAAAVHRAVAQMIREGLVCAVHDVSDGGVITAITEMCMASDRSCRIHTGIAGAAGEECVLGLCDSLALYVVEVVNGQQDAFLNVVNNATGPVPCNPIGTILRAEQGATDSYLLLERTMGTNEGIKVSLSELRDAWKAPLDW